MKLFTPVRAGILALSGFVIAVSAACTPVDSTADPNITSSASPGGSKAAGKATKKAPVDDGLSEITYKIGGSARRGMLTYTTPSGQSQTTTNVPWSKKLKFGDGEFVSISAQNEGSGTITCQILVDGKVMKKNTASGAYTIASCDMMLGF